MVAARDSALGSREVELKLVCDPADTARIAAHPALQASLPPPQEQDLISTYFDTGDFALRKAGVYLRVRNSGGRYVQTVKADTQLLERLEWEREISSPSPDLDAAQGTALAPLLTTEVRRSLQLLFETRIRRKTYLIEHGGAEIEVAIDRGEIVAGSRRHPVSELELELKRGQTAALFHLARVLADALPLRLAVKTKAERGFALIEGGTHEVEKAGDIDIPPEMPSGDAFRAIARSCLRQIVVNEPAMCRGHAEALHQMRIGLRRLRAAISIFADVAADEDQERVKTELKWITRELGPARDLDVFAADALKPLKAVHPNDTGIAAIHRDFEERRKEAYDRAASSVRSDRFRIAMLDLAEWVESGPWANDAEREKRRTRAVAKQAKKRLARLRKRIKGRGDDLRHRSVGQRHKLRIRAKRLRYATEFFAATFPGDKSAKRRAECLSALKDLQDALGGLNDIATRHVLVARGGADKANGPQDPASIHGSAAGAPADALLRAAEQALARFARARAFWKA